MKETLVILSLLFVVTISKAQDFQGIATYKTHQKVDIKLDSTQMNSEMQKRMMDMLKKQFEKTFLLTFNKQESVYKEDESLSPPSVGGGMEVMVMGSGGSDILYKNTKNNTFTNQNEVFGKIFLIKDTLQNQNWKLESETKNIGEYTCFKATYTKEIEVKKAVFGNNDTINKPIEKKKQVVTAWYTPQIPVNNGPAKYQGLPGLILEINDGDQTIICSKIVLNPEEKTQIKELSKGKEVNQSQFKDIMDKKFKEMEERYKPKKGAKDDGHTIEIIIGG